MRLGSKKACDVKSGTEVIVLVLICYKSLLFGQAYDCKMPSRCVVFGCSNTPDPKNGIILHKIPYEGDSRPEAIKRRKRWVDFVKRKRAKWEPSSTSCICSKHFEPDAFVRKVNLPGQETYIPWLKKDEVGVSSFPTLFTANEGDEETTKRTARALRRKVRQYTNKWHI